MKDRASRCYVAAPPNCVRECVDPGHHSRSGRRSNRGSTIPNSAPSTANQVARCFPVAPPRCAASQQTERRGEAARGRGATPCGPFHTVDQRYAGLAQTPNTERRCRNDDQRDDKNARCSKQGPATAPSQNSIAKSNPRGNAQPVVRRGTRVMKPAAARPTIVPSRSSPVLGMSRAARTKPDNQRRDRDDPNSVRGKRINQWSGRVVRRGCGTGQSTVQCCRGRAAAAATAVAAKKSSTWSTLSRLNSDPKRRLISHAAHSASPALINAKTIELARFRSPGN